MPGPAELGLLDVNWLPWPSSGRIGQFTAVMANSVELACLGLRLDAVSFFGQVQRNWRNCRVWETWGDMG
jgi:hypothetical protein